MKNLYSTKEIAKSVNRSPVTVSSLLNRLKLTPAKKEHLQGRVYRNFYTELQKQRIMNFYNDLDMIYTKRCKTLFPEVIYVHTTWEILESKLNFTKRKKR